MARSSPQIYIISPYREMFEVGERQRNISDTILSYNQYDVDYWLIVGQMAL